MFTHNFFLAIIVSLLFEIVPQYYDIFLRVVHFYVEFYTVYLFNSNKSNGLLSLDTALSCAKNTHKTLINQKKVHPQHLVNTSRF